LGLFDIRRVSVHAGVTAHEELASGDEDHVWLERQRTLHDGFLDHDSLLLCLFPLYFSLFATYTLRPLNRLQYHFRRHKEFMNPSASPTCQRNVLQHNLAEHVPAAESLHRIQNLNPRQTSLCVAVSSNAFCQVLSGHCGLNEPDVKHIYF
jgi:hypothetical protein